VTPYERVQQSRQLTAATFPLPSVLDCIRYAITELAEYDDAMLRAERTGDKRNNDKAHDPRSELGQALYMLLSAAVQRSTPLHTVVSWRLADPGYITAMVMLCEVAQCIMDSNCTPTLHMDYAYTAMIVLAATNGWNVDALIDDTCAAFERKHAPVEVR